MQLCVRDETTTGQSIYQMTIDFLTERITVRDLSRERVHHEVREFNRRQGDVVFRGLVQPTNTEQVLSAGHREFRFKQHRQIEWEVQCERALKGFANNSFFVLIDKRQAESLEQEFNI